MDRSFLSQPAVIEASRQFVCVRLTTYEDKEEAAFMKTLIHTRSGEVENSMFTILGPDGKERLVRSGRGMHPAFTDAASMAAGLDKILESYHPKSTPATLPLVNDFRLALDVAAADNQPLVVLVADDAARRKALEAVIARLAWSRDFIGRFVYVTVTDRKALATMDGVQTDAALLVIQPDKFGLKGKTLAQTGTTTEKELAGVLADGAKAFVPENKSTQSHIREGQKQGVFWETKTPVTDPQEAAARERTRKKP